MTTEKGKIGPLHKVNLCLVTVALYAKGRLYNVSAEKVQNRAPCGLLRLLLQLRSNSSDSRRHCLAPPHDVRTYTVNNIFTINWPSVASMRTLRGMH